MWLPHRAACFPGGPGFRREFLSADYPACLAGHAGHVYLGVGIHATGDERPGICDRSHVLSTSLGRTGMAPPGRDERTEHFRDNRGQAPTRSRSPRPARVTRPSTPAGNPSGQFGEVVGELVVSGEGHCAVAVHPSCAGAGGRHAGDGRARAVRRRRGTRWPQSPCSYLRRCRTRILT